MIGKPTLTHGSLFSGIGGFELAASWAGIPTLWSCEKDPFCRKVLKKNFPDTIQYEDIKELSNPPYVDILSGGFPCQPFSVAGKQNGKEDDRYLWPEMLRVISEVRPSWIIGENVTGIISMALDEVLSTLEGEGYACQTFIIPACGVNAPHRRDRVWIVAYSDRSGRVQQWQGATNKDGQRDLQNEESGRDTKQIGSINSSKTIAYSKYLGLDAAEVGQELCERDGYSKTWEGDAIEFKGCPKKSPELFANANGKRVEESFSPSLTDEQRFNNRAFIANWTNWPTQPPVCNGDDGLPSGLVRLTGKRFSRLRKEAIKGGGNAVVPQIPYQIFKAIKEIEHAA